MTTPLLFDSTWLQQQNYETAEAIYQEKLAGGGEASGANSSQGGVSASIPVQSSLKSEIAQARQNIQKALKDESGNTSGGDNSQIMSRLQSLEAENNSLKKASQDLQSLVKKLESRIAVLEKSSSGSAPAPATPAAPAPATPAAPAPAAKDDDDDDFFNLSDDSSDDDEAEAERQKALDAYKNRKAKKPAVIAKSSLLIDVKPWDDETDMKALEACVRTIEMDGLLWGTGKLAPVGYGIRKLVINAVIEDDKVSTDDLEDKITAFEDFVQSMDIAAFNKI